MSEAGFEKMLESAINSHSIENESNTPDWILAEFARKCLTAFAEASNARERWYGCEHVPGRMAKSSPMEDPPPEGMEDVDIRVRVPKAVAWAIRSGQLKGVSMGGSIKEAPIAVNPACVGPEEESHDGK